jgi:glutathione S-transferase
MIKVHHLNNSRSQRILWLLEELGLDYEIVKYQRDPQTMLAPPSLKAIHPLGKSPIFADDDHLIAESGAIVEYVIERYGDGRLAPHPASSEWPAYIEWLHYAEGSAMLPLMLALYVGRLGDAAAPLFPRIASETANNLSYIQQSLDGRDYLLGVAFTGADIQVSFVLEAAKSGGQLAAYPVLEAYLARLRARPPYQRAIEKGGEYTIGR